MYTFGAFFFGRPLFRSRRCKSLMPIPFSSDRRAINSGRICLFECPMLRGKYFCCSFVLCVSLSVFLVLSFTVYIRPRRWLYYVHIPHITNTDGLNRIQAAQICLRTSYWKSIGQFGKLSIYWMLQHVIIIGWLNFVCTKHEAIHKDGCWKRDVLSGERKRIKTNNCFFFLLSFWEFRCWSTGALNILAIDCFVFSS